MTTRALGMAEASTTVMLITKAHHLTNLLRQVKRTDSRLPLRIFASDRSRKIGFPWDCHTRRRGLLSMVCGHATAMPLILEPDSRGFSERCQKRTGQEPLQ